MSAPLLAVMAAACLALALFAGLLLLAQRMRSENLQQRFAAVPGGRAARRGGNAVWAQLAEQGRQVDALFDEQGETERLLLQAGMRSAGERTPYFVAQILLPLAAVVGSVLAIALNWFEGDTVDKLIRAFVLVALSLLGPRWWLKRRASARRARLRGEVPMLIHLLALLFDAGLSLRQALSTLTAEGAMVLPHSSRELGAVLRQLEAGAEVDEVIRATAQALEVTELASVLAVLQQVDRYGGELRAPLMDVLELVEKRRELSLRERVSALSGRMTIVMVLFFFPALLIFVAGPAVLVILAALGAN